MMWNSDKEVVKDKAEKLANQAEMATEELSMNAKAKIDKAANKAEALTNETKNQTDDLVRSLKSLVNEYADSSKVSDFRDQISDKASELKSVVTEEVSNAYYKGKERASEAVREHPVGTLALVAGAGLLLGYVLGTKQSSK
jgi:ElaB/YqjD/DUF883 family membrane-anchored ribosome-binding protein